MLLRRGFALEYVTLTWNLVGTVVLAVAALMAGSVALAGFGVDSLIEIVASTVVLGLSVSLDELAVGFTLGLLRLPTLLVVVPIGVQAFVLSQLGLRLGARVGSDVREGAERLAGLGLIALGLGLADRADRLHLVDLPQWGPRSAP